MISLMKKSNLFQIKLSKRNSKMKRTTEKDLKEAEDEEELREIPNEEDGGGRELEDDDDNVNGDDDDSEDDDGDGNEEEDDEEEEEEIDFAETTEGNTKVKAADKQLKRQRTPTKSDVSSTQVAKKAVTMVNEEVTELSDEPSAKKKKLSKAELYKPPTNEELNQLKETENLFHSTLFRMQVKYFCLVCIM